MRKKEREERNREKYIFVNIILLYFVALCALRSIGHLLIVKYNFQRACYIFVSVLFVMPNFQHFREQRFAHITFNTEPHAHTHLYLEIEIFSIKPFQLDTLNFVFSFFVVFLRSVYIAQL